MKKVWIYIRVSTDEQVLHGNVFTDEWKSWAQKEDRPALKELFRSAQNKEIEVVLVWKIDRLFRKTLFLLESIEALENMWVGFTSITQPFDTTHAFWKMSLQMMGVIWELERELIKERTYNGILASMKKWKWGRGNTPYGYRKDENGFLIPFQEEVDIIQMIYRLLLKDGLSTAQIVNKLNEMGIETYWGKWWLWKGRQQTIKHKNFWRKSTVSKILHNEVYFWRLVQNKYKSSRTIRVEKPESEWIISTCPSIITEDDFNRAQKILEENQKFSKRNTKKWEVYMLAKLLQCDVTGYKYIGYKSTKGTKNYRLNVNKTKVANFEKIGQRWVSAIQIEWAVWKMLKNVLQNPNILESEILKSWDKIWNKMKDIKKQIQILDESLQKLEDNSKWLLKLISWSDESSVNYVQSQLSENAHKTKGIKDEKLQLQERLSGVWVVHSKVNDFSQISSIVKGNLDKLDYQTKATICQLLINRVVFDGTNAKIELIVPMSTESKSKLKTDHALNFFQEKQWFLNEKVQTFINDVGTGLKFIHNLRTHYHHLNFHSLSKLCRKTIF